MQRVLIRQLVAGRRRRPAWSDMLRLRRSSPLLASSASAIGGANPDASSLWNSSHCDLVSAGPSASSGR